MDDRPAPPAWPRRAAFAAVVALYVLLFPYHPGLRSPNELCRLWQTRSLVEYGELRINQALRDYGYVGDLSRKDGRFYPSKAPLLSLAAVPHYAVLRALGGGFRYAVPEVPLVYFSRLLWTVLPTLLALLWVRRFLGAYVSAGVADAVAVTWALGSLAFSYSLLFMSHQPSAVLLFGGFYALWRCARGQWRERGYLVAGAAAGAAVLAEYTAALGVLGLVLYGAVSVLQGGQAPARERRLKLARALALATAGALPFVFGLMGYHQAAFDHPLHSGYKYLNDAAYQGWHLGGFLGIRLPDPRAFALSFFSPLRGLFVLSPFLLLALAGLGRLRRADRPVFWLTVALLAGYAYFTSSFSYESWGWTTGPRHLTALVPFLLLPVALFVDSAASWVRGAAAGLCAASVLVTGAATTVNYVPDSVSNVLRGLVLPLWADGFLPPTLLATVLPAWVGGALAIALLLASAIIVVVLLLPPERRAPVASAAALVTVLFIGGLLLVRGDTDGDRGARQHLESVWITRSGQLPFWPRR